MTIFQLFGSRFIHWTLLALDTATPYLAIKAVAPGATVRNRIDPMSTMKSGGLCSIT